MTLDRTKLLC